MGMLITSCLATSALATSHVMVSLGSSRYEHGNQVPMAQPPNWPHPPMAMNSGMDMMEPSMEGMEQEMKMSMEPMPMAMGVSTVYNHCLRPI